MTIPQAIIETVERLDLKEQRRVLDFARALRRHDAQGDDGIGEAGAKLIAEVLEPEDFSGWWNKDG